MTLPTGSRLGPYEISAPIGAGGMGEVYRARDSKLGRTVAIKVLPAAFAGDSERLARFQREAKVLASMNHPNIATIHGLEDSGGTYALVMEFVEGPTLADRIKQGPMPIDEALKIAKQICDALEYAHERGIVHRDLKPANVKLTNDDAVKLLDFGLAKALEGDPSSIDISSSPTMSRMATMQGVLLGTAAYMSPEQAKAKSVDRRADIWAFGCVLYEMLTGKMAFSGETVTDTLAAVIKEEPDWSRLPAGTSGRVRVLLQRCLQKDPKQRLRDIGDARISLDEVLAGAPDSASVTPQTAKPKWRYALPWLLFAVTAISLAAFVFVHFLEAPPVSAPVLRYQIFPPGKANFEGDFELSPDGRHLAFKATTEDGRSQLWIRDLDALEAHPLAGTEDAVWPFWSPDSRVVGFSVGTRLETLDISGGVPHRICEFPGGAFLGASWNRDGVIVFGTTVGIMKVSAAGGTPSLLTRVDSSRGETSHAEPAFLPDGYHFLYVRSPGSDEGTYVGSIDLGPEQQGTQRLVSGEATYTPASRNEPGYLVFMPTEQTDTIMVQVFDPSTMRVKGNVIPLDQKVLGFTASDSDVLAYMSATQTQLTWYDRQGKVVRTLGDPESARPNYAVSPDGGAVAISRGEEDNYEALDLWVYYAARTPIRLTFDGKSNAFPVWSPDGSHIAFASRREGPVTAQRAAVNGIGQIEALDKEPAVARIPTDWSHDGSYLIEEALVDAKSRFSIWVLPLIGKQAGGGRKSFPYLTGRFNYVSGALSPNGRWLAYASDETGRYEVYVQTFPKPGGKWAVSTNGGRDPAWSYRGDELYFLGGDRRLMATDVRSGSDGSFEATAPKPLFQTHVQQPQVGFITFAVSKDGHFLMATPVSQSGTPITVIVNWPSLLTK